MRMISLLIILTGALSSSAYARLDEDTAQLLRPPVAEPALADLDAEIYRVRPVPKRVRRPSAEAPAPPPAANGEQRAPASANPVGG